MLPPLRAPTIDSQYLVHPTPDRAVDWLNRNMQLWPHNAIRLDGVPLVALRRALRQQIAAWTDPPIRTPLDRPWIVSGHQPELEHPGVWVKHFLLHGFAAYTQATPLHLIADHDLPKTNGFTCPWIPPARQQRAVRLVVPYDRADLITPYEVRPLYDVELFVTVVERGRALTEHWGYEPLLLQIWPRKLPAAGRLADVLTRLRQQQERLWGCCNHELPVSRLAQTEAFQRFARHLLADLPRFRRIYNNVLRRLREQGAGIQPLRAIAELEAGEAPFWEIRGHQRLRATANSPLAALRPRALTLTLFVRLVLADIFLHGLGGAIYDQATDLLIQEYFEASPPAYLTATATLFLPITHLLQTPNSEPPPQPARQLWQLWRDHYWNPQRHLPPTTPPAAHQLALQKQQHWLAEPPHHDHAARRLWFRCLRNLTVTLRQYLAEPLQQLQQAYAQAYAWEQRQRLIYLRDYSWVLFPEWKLRPFLTHFLDWRNLRDQTQPPVPQSSGSEQT
jgi:hypothetical protein